jgi:hypothetical protein
MIIIMMIIITIIITIRVCSYITDLSENFKKESSTKNKCQDQNKKIFENHWDRKDKGRGGGLERTSRDRNREKQTRFLSLERTRS